MSSMRWRLFAAKIASSLSTWGLKNVFRRPASSLPGRLALKIDPQVISHLKYKLGKGCIVVSGTNGKTTVTNLLADTLEESGEALICNRSGANLSFGIASALLQGSKSDWGVFECDEMWLTKIMPQLQPKYLLLLNLFSDQLDRVGEVSLVQDSIKSAIASSPKTVLIFNADDPLCAEIAERVPNESLSYGVDEPLDQTQVSLGYTQICLTCFNKLKYQYRHYEQLGSYECLSCGFRRPEPEYTARDLSLGSDLLSFTMHVPGNMKYAVKALSAGSYMVYNFLAVGVGSHVLGCPFESFERTLGSLNPQMGRLQALQIEGRSVLLNLAKNPAGFNQSLEIAMRGEGPKVFVFYINDKKGDGRDVSWLWDVHFEQLASEKDTALYVGGLRKKDLQLRLKYADLEAQPVESVKEVFKDCDQAKCRYYFIANYTALQAVQEELAILSEEDTSQPRSFTTDTRAKDL